MKKLVKILAVKDEEIIVIEQFRETISKTTIELPGGKIENGETPVDAAKRELREETGITSKEFINLGTYVNSVGNVEVNLFFTNKVEKIENQKLDKDESIDVQTHPVQLVLDNISTNKWDDIRLGMAFLIARARGLIH
jgi:ADP-ribose pyrophosphatase